MAIHESCEDGLRSHWPNASVVLSFVTTRLGPRMLEMFFSLPPPGP